MYRHDSGVFVAQDAASGKVLPFPSSEPYAVTFISKDEYDELYGKIQREAVDELLQSLRQAANEISAFSFVGDTLTGPPNYACFTPEELEEAILHVE